MVRFATCTFPIFLRQPCRLGRIASSHPYPGLVDGVTLCTPIVPWCCDMGGRDTLGRLIDPWYIHETPALRYYDPVNIAKRIPKTCRVEITRAGLGDYCCPPSGIAVLYNNIPVPRAGYFRMRGSSRI